MIFPYTAVICYIFNAQGRGIAPEEGAGFWERQMERAGR